MHVLHYELTMDHEMLLLAAAIQGLSQREKTTMAACQHGKELGFFIAFRILFFIYFSFF